MLANAFHCILEARRIASARLTVGTDSGLEAIDFAIRRAKVSVFAVSRDAIDPVECLVRSGAGGWQELLNGVGARRSLSALAAQRGALIGVFQAYYLANCALENVLLRHAFTASTARWRRAEHLLQCVGMGNPAPQFDQAVGR